MHEIYIAKVFSKTPGGRFKKDGPCSGEEFREKFLDCHFKDTGDRSKIRIVFDGAVGYATSFLEEAFGGLARKYGKEGVLSRLTFVSDEDPILIENVKKFIEDS